MLKKPGVTYEFHHIGYVSDEPIEGEFYSSKFDAWTADVKGSRIGAQIHRFGKNHPFHPAITKWPHVGFKVNDIEKAVEGEEVIMAIHEPIKGFKSAMILDAGIPIELVETNLDDETLIQTAKSGGSTMRDID